MKRSIKNINLEVYKKCDLNISGFQIEKESKDYNACRFELNNRKIISRDSKITPKKVGQFVTFWKRNENGTIQPFEENDPIDFYVVNIKTEKHFGQFVFPKSILIKKGIISTEKKDGKRAFRVYPSWDIPNNKQSEKTQNWQLTYFYEITNSTNLKKVIELYKTE